MTVFRISKVAKTAIVAVGLAAAGFASAQSTVKIAFIDPLSGPFAPVGQNQLNSWNYIVDLANAKNWATGVKFQMVPFDNKTSPQEALTALKSVIDQGIRYVVQGNGSAVALALSDAISKHNERNPGKELVYINYAAVDPDLTNSKCSFWHFRIDVNGDMKMEALTSYMAGNKDIKNVYLINQNYSFGQQVARAAKEYLGRKRPDIKIVGEDLHPIGQVKDFAPYVAKIKASGADTIITGNWGTDLALLVKAAKDANLSAAFYTYYAGTTGVPTAMGAVPDGKVKVVANWIGNNEKFVGADIVEGYKKRFNDDFYTAQTHAGLTMLAAGMNKAKSTDPIKVAFAMEGIKFSSINGDLEMRATDHQMQQPIYIGTWAKVDGKKVKYDQENTGYGFRMEQKLDSFVAAQPTSCVMKRPAKPN
jgi:branched-chain amino acid transport system substrate-binding protein